MKAARAPFVPVPLDLSCPRCGGQVWLRQWEKHFYARCEGQGCRFGFDADRKGRPVAECSACGGRLRTTPKGRVCADCDRWDKDAGERARPQEVCPRCKTGRLSVIRGEYGHFLACGDPACGLTCTCDAKGRPEGGRCRQCRGPVRRTRSGARICVVCETWQDPRPLRPPSPGSTRPPAAPCPVCEKPLRSVWTRRQRWVYRCDACGRWLPPPVPAESAD